MFPRNVLRFSLLLLVSVGISLTPQPLSAQTFTVLHSFSGGGDGAAPAAGLTVDAAGNLYGTAEYGGDTQSCYQGCGTVFRLSHRNSGWVLSTLYEFHGGGDGAGPMAGIVFGPDGALYGTTSVTSGSCSGDCIVFRLTPPVTFCHSVSCPWTKTVLYRFTGLPDGDKPSRGNLVFDRSGNIYGTTQTGGTNGYGTVYKLARNGSGWSETILYNFTGQGDGGNPVGGVTFDAAGTLWGTTSIGGLNSPPDIIGPGVIFNLTPSGSGWIESTFYEFRDDTSDGGVPAASLTLGSDGFLYGSTLAGGGGFCQAGNFTGCGTAYRVAGGSLSSLYYGFPNYDDPAPLSGPLAPVSLDSARNVYGTTTQDGQYSGGNVFKLAFPNYTYSTLHDFTGGLDGGYPISTVAFDSSGNMYGTALSGGGSPVCSGGCGVVWEITP